MEFPVLTATQWTLAIIASACIGLSKTGFGGLGMVTVVLMAQVLPAKESTGVVLPMLVGADIIAVVVFRRHAAWKHLVRIIPPAALGVVLGFLLMPHVPDEIFAPVIGSIILLMVVLQYLRRWKPNALQHLPESRRFAWGMGSFSGVTTMLANAAGPVMTLYLLARKVPKYEFVGTAAVFFLGLNIFKIPFSYGLGLINGSSLTLNLTLLPAVAIGAIAGRYLIGLIPEKAYTEMLLVFTTLAALKMILF